MLNTFARLLLVFVLAVAAMVLPATFRDGPGPDTLMVAVGAMVLAYAAWVAQCVTQPASSRNGSSR